MANLFGKIYSKQELMELTGQISQVAGIEAFEYSDGAARGVRNLEFRTGTGFRFTVLVDRAMDIHHCELNGRPIGWHSAVGVRHPAYFEPQNPLGFLRQFSGLLVTCGLDHAFFGEKDDTSFYLYPDYKAEQYPLHGRVANLPARLKGYGETWHEGECVLWAEGTVKQSMVFGENLELTRRISTHIGANSFNIHDEVSNAGFYPTPHMYLAHINIGFPIVDAGSEFVAPIRKIQWATKSAHGSRSAYRIMDPPQSNHVEHAYDHQMSASQDGTVVAALVNRKFNQGEGFGVYLRYNQNQYKYFTEWRNLNKSSYVVGLEPCTASVADGRIGTKEKGKLTILQPGEKQTYDLEIGVLVNNLEIEKLVAEIQKLEHQPNECPF